jgi:hypothetical protein
MRNQRFSGQRVQNLRQMGMHALSLTCGEDDDIHVGLLNSKKKQAKKGNPPAG